MNDSVRTPSSMAELKPYDYGALVIIQGATSESETTFNVLVPRLKAKTFGAYVYDKKHGIIKNFADIDSLPHTQCKLIGHFTDQKKIAHYVVNKYKCNGLNAKTDYHLSIANPGVLDEATGKRKYSEVADTRTFKMLKNSGNSLKFAMGSCMTDSFAYKHIRDHIWNSLVSKKPEVIFLTGDLVYVDGFDTVAREDSKTGKASASDFDIWQRFIDTTQAIPLYRQKNLIPIIATWDDHDMVTNNSSENTKRKDSAHNAFRAFFGSEAIEGVFEPSAVGMYSKYSIRNQVFYMMDGRYFREEVHIGNDGLIKNEDKSSKEEIKLSEGNVRVKKYRKLSKFAHWGRAQHQWLVKNLKDNAKPSWVINGDQIFAPAILSKRETYTKRINESIMADHKKHFQKIIKDLSKIDSPIAFGSGDIHFSEILKIEKEQLGYETYEFTSSPVHSYMFREGGELWENKRRIAGAAYHNFMMIQSKAISSKELHVNAMSYDALGNVIPEIKSGDLVIKK
jgi:phosphodiesterase/alkaline phosphatase D-like protein